MYEKIMCQYLQRILGELIKINSKLGFDKNKEDEDHDTKKS